MARAPAEASPRASTFSPPPFVGGGKIVTTFVGEPVRPIQRGFAS